MESQKTCRVEIDKLPGIGETQNQKMNKKIMYAAFAVVISHGLTYGQEMTDSLPEVVVTGTGTEHLLRNAPVQTEIISRKMLDSYGGKNLEDILGGLTASFAFSEGDMGSQMQLGGLGNSYILILIDGKRIHGDVGGENDLGLIDPNNIERIEVVKGAQSALYGSDAMAGVINIITKKHPESGLYLENTTRYGSHNDVRQHNGVGFSWGKWTSYTNFQVQHTDGWQNTAREYAEAQVFEDSKTMTLNKYTNWQIAERLNYQATKQLSVYAEGMYYNKVINRPQDGKHASFDVYTYDLMYRNASAATGAKWNLNKTDFLTLDVDWNKHAYYYEYTATTLADGYDPLGNFTNYFPYFRGQKSLQSDQQRVMANLKGVFALPYSQTLSAGWVYRYDYLKAPMRTVKKTVDDQSQAVFVQDEFNYFPWMNVTVGMRLNHNENYGYRFTPKVSTMFALGDFRLRLGWSQGFKTPTTKELYYRYLHVMGSTQFFNIGNTDLKAQTSNYYSAGLEYRGRKLTVSATIYRNVLDHMIALVNVPVSEIPTDVTSSYSGDGSEKVVARKYMNMEDARTMGVDVNINYQVNKELSVGGNYAWLDTKAHEYDTKKERLHEVTIDGMAHSKWNAFVNWQHRWMPRYQLGVNLSTRGSSRRYYQNNGNGAPFQLWRLNTTHDIGPAGKPLAFRLEAGVDNIFNHVDRTMHPYHLGTNSSGTTVYVGVTVKFNQGKKMKMVREKKSSGEDEE